MIKEINDTIDFIMKNDPASKSKLEVLLLYPGLHAVIGHKISNFLYKSSPRSSFVFSKLPINLSI